MRITPMRHSVAGSVMMCKWSLLCVALVAGTAVGTVGAATSPEVAAEQNEQVPLVHRGAMALGGIDDQQLAQVFELAWPGQVSHVLVPIWCHPDAMVTLTIQASRRGAPSGSVLATQRIPGHALDAGATSFGLAYRMLELQRPIALRPGAYAFTLAVDKPGVYDCGVAAAPNGNYYVPGNAYFISGANGPGWVQLFDAGGVMDMAFQVYARPL